MKSSPSPQLVYSCVQKMNNSAALCLEIGQYERAIKSLAKSLQISRAYIRKSHENNLSQSSAGTNTATQETSPQASACHHSHLCSLDGCINFSEENRLNSHVHRILRSGNDRSGLFSDNSSEESIRNRFLVRRQQRRCQESSSLSDKKTNSNNNDFLYRQLIQVPPLSVLGEHSICPRHIVSLSFISIFNLAVVCHIRGMDYKKNGQASARVDLLKALKLYEVAYQALEKHSEFSSDIDYSKRNSIQFKLILCNNLSHIHNLAGNRSEHELYLREVLSVTMSLIDSQRPWSTSNESDDDLHKHQKRCIDLEGFLSNAAPLMSDAFCAEAA